MKETYRWYVRHNRSQAGLFLRRRIDRRRARVGLFGPGGLRRISKRRTPEAKKSTLSNIRFQPGWDDQKVGRVLSHYHEWTEEDAILEDESDMES